MAQPSERERDLRAQIVQFGRLCYERRLLVGLDGNLSVRLDAESVLCTRSGCHKGLLTDADLLVVSMSGERIRGEGAPTSELAMHLACYAARPDVQAVLHAHPPVAVAFTVAGQDLGRCVLPELVLTLGVIPTLPYERTGTAALAAQVGAAAREHDAMLLDHHGAVVLGDSLLTAFCRLETVEHTAIVLHAASGLGAIRELPVDEAVALRRLGLTRYGGPPAAVARVDEPFADLDAACAPRPSPR